jgi:hypothetical protein
MSVEIRRGRIREARRRPTVGAHALSFLLVNILISRKRNDDSYFAENIRDEYANGQLDAQVESTLGEMKQLAIYGI